MKQVRNWCIPLFLVATLLVIVAFLFPRHAFSGDGILFTDVAASPTADPDSPALRAKLTQVNWEALRNGEAERIQLNLFDGQVITAERVRRDTSALDGYVWIGRIPDRPQSEVYLSVAGDVLVGTITLDPLEIYQVRYAGRQGHTLRQLDPLAPGPTEGIDAIVPPETAAAAEPDTAESAVCVDDGQRIDLLVAYTAAARVAAGGQAAMTALINQRISEANSANANSGVAFTFNLVHAMETGYRESGDMGTDLERLQMTDDGFMDNVHSARNQHHADVVALLTAEGSNGSCGLAYIMTRPENWFAGYAFSVSALDYPGAAYCPDTTLTHEIGHNLGNQHDRASSGGVGVTPYAFGYQSASRSFRTIMSYDCPGGCPGINYWSNPRISYRGEPLGVDYASNPGRAADNVRSMNEIRNVAANFRQACQTTPPTRTPPPTPTPLPTPSGRDDRAHRVFVAVVFE